MLLGFDSKKYLIFFSAAPRTTKRETRCHRVPVSFASGTIAARSSPTISCTSTTCKPTRRTYHGVKRWLAVSSASGSAATATTPPSTSSEITSSATPRRRPSHVPTAVSCSPQSPSSSITASGKFQLKVRFNEIDYLFFLFCS